jgi:hypothetical protein
MNKALFFAFIALSCAAVSSLPVHGSWKVTNALDIDHAIEFANGETYNFAEKSATEIAATPYFYDVSANEEIFDQYYNVMYKVETDFRSQDSYPQSYFFRLLKVIALTTKMRIWLFGVASGKTVLALIRLALTTPLMNVLSTIAKLKMRLALWTFPTKWIAESLLLYSDAHL